MQHGMFFTYCTFIHKRSTQDTLIYFMNMTETSTVLAIQTFTPTSFKHNTTYNKLVNQLFWQTKICKKRKFCL